MAIEKNEPSKLRDVELNMLLQSINPNHFILLYDVVSGPLLVIVNFAVAFVLLY